MAEKITKIYFSAVNLLLLCALFVSLSIVTYWQMQIPQPDINPLIAKISYYLGIASIFMGVSVSLALLVALFMRKPLIMIDGAGIFIDCGKKNKFKISWNEIKEVNLYKRPLFGHYVVINTKNNNAFFNAPENESSKKRMGNNINLFGAPIAISGRGLSMDSIEIYKAIKIAMP